MDKPAAKSALARWMICCLCAAALHLPSPPPAGAVESSEVSTTLSTQLAPPSSQNTLHAGAVHSIQTAAGEHHTCTLDEDLTVSCWGANTSGQVGDGTTFSRQVPTFVAGLNDATKLTAGRDHTCAMRNDGTIACWGSNTSGQLGHGTRTIRELSPIDVPGIDSAVDVAAGAHHTCALLVSAEVYCWGYNGTGQLGDGSTQDRSVPGKVFGLPQVTELAAGEGHTCALASTGSINCWGGNHFGELGDGTDRERLSPTTVAGITDSVHIAAGDLHTCAILENGAVRCWGYNHHGHIGDGTETHRLIPVPVVGISDAHLLAAGDSHTCAARLNGTILCWGDDGDGQLGDGTEVEARLTPVTVALIEDAHTISAGGAHTCATQFDGDIFCWGSNTWGQLGIDGTHHSSLPIEVIRQTDIPVPKVPTIGEDIQVGDVNSRGPGDDQILRLYRAAFGRYPDQGGFDYWANQYRGGRTLQSIAAFFVVSPESEGLYGPNPTDRGLIDAMYQNVLGRAGETEGVNYWLARVAAGMSRPDLLIAFADSPENISGTQTREPIDSIQSQILRIYQAVFGRAPEQEGFDYWTAQYRTGSSFISIAKSFSVAPEFRSRYGDDPSNAQIIEALYQNVLGRPGEPEGVAYWMEQRDDGMSTPELLVAFANSAENLALTGTIP